MDCELCASELSAYLDQELSEGRNAQVSKHVEGCSSCAEELESLKRAKVFVENHIGELELRPEIWKSVRAQIATMEAPDPSAGFFSFLFTSRWRTATAATAIALSIAVGMWQYLQYREARKDLQQYMTDYIQTREMKDGALQLPGADMAGNASNANLLHLKYMNNPFVFDRSEDIQSNPFRTEDR
jgi:anti-sigma factor RsiW